MAKAKAVFPVPGGPANNIALPAIFLNLIKSTTIPDASLAISYPTIPADTSIEVHSSVKPRPLICECVAILYVLVVDLTSSIFI
jgi:hypothetical protein